MAKKIKVVSIFKGAQGVSNYEVGAEMKKMNEKNEWESLGKKVKKIDVNLKNDTVEITLSDKTSIFFKGFPIAIDYTL
jgi:hypothetical protein